MKDRSISFPYCLKSKPISFYPCYDSHEEVAEECMLMIEQDMGGDKFEVIVNELNENAPGFHPWVYIREIRYIESEVK